MFVYVFVRKTLVSIPTTTVTITTPTIIANGECMCIAFAHETLVTIATTKKMYVHNARAANSATAVAPHEYSAACARRTVREGLRPADMKEKRKNVGNIKNRDVIKQKSKICGMNTTI